MTLFHVIALVLGACIGAGLGALFGASDVRFCGIMGFLAGFIFSVTPWFGKTIDWIFERVTGKDKK